MKNQPSKKAEPREWLYGAEYWVPENHMFKSGSDCLEAFPDAGPACGMVSTQAYDALSAKCAELERELTHLRGDRDKFLASDDCFYWTHEAQKERDELKAQVQQKSDELTGCEQRLSEYMVHLKDLRDDWVKMKNAMKFYGDEKIYNIRHIAVHVDGIHAGICSDVHFDGGKQARETVANLKHKGD